jgi:hypothetical protein
MSGVDRPKVVAMTLIPGRMRRGQETRSDLGYAPYSLPTWRWWCAKNGVQLVLLNQPQLAGLYDDAPPTFQRWNWARRIFDEFGPNTQLAIVDADTMIRWDAPDFFEIAKSAFCAVRAHQPRWILRSLRAYQGLFPSVTVPWWEYFNAGFVVMTRACVPVCEAFLQFVLQNRSQLHLIQASQEDLGTDQTPLNYFLRQQALPLQLLPPPFNLLDTFPTAYEAYEKTRRKNPADWASFDYDVFSEPSAFDFIELGFIWHFGLPNVIKARLMRETWSRVKDFYPGVEVETAAIGPEPTVSRT